MRGMFEAIERLEAARESVMDLRTLEALKGSIAKWEAIVAGAEEDRGGDNCPLRQIFCNDEVPAKMLCRGCPVFESTGRTACQGSPYPLYTVGERAGTTEAAQAELDFLRSLLPAEHASPQPVLPPVTSGANPAPTSDNNAASLGVAGGADLCPCGRPDGECER
jgi:hypothetical protein